MGFEGAWGVWGGERFWYIRRGRQDMFKELDCVVLTTDIEKDGLKAGDAGTIVHMYPGGDAFVVEFTKGDVYTVILADMLPSQVRLETSEDIDRARNTDVQV